MSLSLLTAFNAVPAQPQRDDFSNNPFHKLFHTQQYVEEQYKPFTSLFRDAFGYDMPGQKSRVPSSSPHSSFFQPRTPDVPTPKARTFQPHSPVLLKKNQKLIDAWCDAYHFEEGKALLEPLAEKASKVHDQILTLFSQGKIHDYCEQPFDSIWTEKHTAFSNPKLNIVPDLTDIQGSKLKRLKQLEAKGLVDLSAQSVTGEELFFQVLDKGSTAHFLGRGHCINQKNSKGETLLMRALQKSKQLKDDFLPYIEFLIEHDAQLNPSLASNVQSPLATLFNAYDVSADLDHKGNDRLVQAAHLLLDSGARMEPRDFYKVNLREGTHFIQEVKENGRLYKSLRKLIKLDPSLLEQILNNGFDLNTEVPVNDFTSLQDAEVLEYETQPFLFSLLKSLGVHDFHFSKTKTPEDLALNKRARTNLVDCLILIRKHYTPDALAELVYQKEGHADLDLVGFAKKYDHTPEKILVRFAEHTMKRSKVRAV